MNLKLERNQCGRDFTIGSLYVGDDWECWTLEDQLRPVGVKVAAQTCIPAGKYLIQLTHSNRFQRILPLLRDVPMFEGIRIHSGNVKEDTEGCIIVGSRGVDRVNNSRVTYERLMLKLDGAYDVGATITLEVV